MPAESTYPCTWVKHLPDLPRKKENSQQYPSVYEDRRPKSIEDTEKTGSKGLLQDKKVSGTCVGNRVTAAPGPHLWGLLQVSWERAELMAPSTAKQDLSSTERHLGARSCREQNKDEVENTGRLWALAGES